MASTKPKPSLKAIQTSSLEEDSLPQIVEEQDVLASAPKTAKAQIRPQRKRRWMLWTSFLLGVIVPGALAIFYWMEHAPERFVTEAGFTVRAVDEGVSLDMMSSLTGLSGGGVTASDTAIVLSFLHSRDLVEKVNADVDLTAAFTATDDPLYRFSGESIEDLVAYWQNRIVLTHDTTTGLVTYQAQAFDSAASMAIATSILTHVEALVNDISAKARQDVLRASEQEVARAENRLREASEALRTFRGQQESLNPFGSGEALVGLIAQIEAQLSEVNRQISTFEGTNISETSPVIVNLRTEKRTLEEQIAALRSQSGADAALMADFEQLTLNQQFAQQSYAAALASLEQARVRADSAQRYLAVFRSPQPAQAAVLPNRALNAALTVIGLFAAWSILTLLTYHIRDKMA